VVSRNMHNLYTLRGTKVRDALRWSGYIDQALTLFGEAEIYFAAHQWPLWGRERIHAFMKQQRDVYKYLHDQTLRLAGKGLTPGEIAEELRMPAALAKSFSSRGYYGTVKHNARAVYQHYFGWYDANPAHLDPLPRSVAAVRYVNAIGGPAALLAQAQQAFEAGDYCRAGPPDCTRPAGAVL
jgi:alkyl sulfatase BDS1-like metallo-beta-lactamase superfamily hydrolase